MPRSLFDKVWDSHLVTGESKQHPALLYIDLHLIHEVTSPQAFDMLRSRGLSVRQSERTLATMDHATPTLPFDDSGHPQFVNESAAHQVQQLEENCQQFGITLHGWRSPNRGIVHVIGPELGATWPGATIVCGDSHTSTHGAFGALAFGIGTSEVGHVLASQCLLQRKPKSMLVEIEGALAPGVTAKDLILAIIGKIGVNGGTGHVLEYRGQAVSDMHMEQRMTLCNMSIEAGARAGMIAPDETTFDYLRGRPEAPSEARWQEQVARWSQLPSDPGAAFDRVVTIDITGLEPQATFGTHPGMESALNAKLPAAETPELKKAYDYMGLTPGRPLLGTPVDVVFIGSCTNSRLTDLEDAAGVFKQRKVAAGVRTLIVPGSEQVKRAAEERGLDQVFVDAGAEWREAGCSMCIAMNGDQVAPGQTAVSTSNRNFAGRQGPGARTILASPLTAAASAVTGRIADARELPPL